MQKLVKIDKIKIGTRARRDLGDIVSLAKGILATKGLQCNDVFIDTDYILIAGERRIRAYTLLSNGDVGVWDEHTPTEVEKNFFLSIPCIVKKREELKEEDYLRFELLENLSRKDFLWHELAGLVDSFHILCQRQYGKASAGATKTGWGIRDTAKELGMNPADVVHYIKLAKGLQTSPDLKDIKQKSKALTKLKRLEIQDIANWLELEDYQDSDIRLITGDSKVVLKDIPDESVDLIITDPPWGIELEDNVHQERDKTYVQYDKDYDTMDTLEILMECFSKLKPNCGIYMFYSAFPEKVIEGQQFLTAVGFSIERIPLIWYKKHILSHNSGETRHYLNYEIILYGWKGERPMFENGKTSRNVFEHQVPYQNRIHSAEKPVSLLSELILLNTQENAFILDPFGGSCNIADACKALKRKCLVVEIEEELVKMASMRLRGL